MMNVEDKERGLPQIVTMRKLTAVKQQSYAKGSRIQSDELTQAYLSTSWRCRVSQQRSVNEGHVQGAWRLSVVSSEGITI